MKEERIYSLDVIKIIATCLIICHHYQQSIGSFYDGKLNFNGGKFYFGTIVELFFLLSGFFMFHYIEKINNGESMISFMLSRIIRLLPVMAISVVMFSIINLFYIRSYGHGWFNLAPDPIGTLISALGLQEGWGFRNPMINSPTWYVSVLLLCYVWFYLITFILYRIKVAPYIGYAFMIAIGVIINQFSLMKPIFNMLASRGYIAFFFGVIFGGILNKIEKMPKWSWILSVLIMIALAVAFFMSDSKPVAFGPVNYFLTFLFAPALIIFMQYSPVSKLFTSEKIGKVSAITYDMYLWHVPFVMFVFVFLSWINVDASILNPYPMMFLFVLIMFVVGYISHRFVEVPITNFLKKIKTQEPQN